MIYDRFENIELYFPKMNKLNQAICFAVDFDKSQPDGRYEIDGDNIYAIVATYNTKDISELKFENHKKYIDIQLMIEGCEFLDVSLDKKIRMDTPYSEKKDVALFKQPHHYTSLLLKPGLFAILYPDDIHQPGRKIEGKKQIRKMVIKVLV